MPKGVEHFQAMIAPLPERLVSNLWCRKALSTFSWLFYSCFCCNVSNLWCRKALSTISHMLTISAIQQCRISDAERRWALSEEQYDRNNLMCRISDAERRWALAAGRINFVLYAMCRISDAERRWALMTKIKSEPITKGVESLMPKGVEHLNDIQQCDRFLVCRISDAERRWAH